MKKILLLICFISCLLGCQKPLPEKSSENFAQAVRAFYVGLAALQVGDDQRAREGLTKTTSLAESEPAAWNNLGVLQMRQKDFEAAANSLEKAKSLDPDQAKIYANLAILETQRGNFEKAAENYNRAIELEPDNLQAIYALAQERERETNDAEALNLYRQISQKAPTNLAIQIEIARLAAKLGNAEILQKAVPEIGKSQENWSPEIKEQYSALETAANTGNARQASTQVVFLRNVLLQHPEFRASLAEIKPSDTSIGELFLNPVKLPTPDFSPAEPDMALTFSASFTENAKANFARAIFLDGENPPVVAWSNEKETRVGKTVLPVSTSNPNQIAAFDLDYDFKNDLAFATESGFRLFKQTEQGNFRDITAETKLSDEILQKSFLGVWSFDIESDGDLDLILASEDGAPTVLQNNSDGSFAEVKTLSDIQHLRDFVRADLDEDGDADAITLNVNGKIQFFANERGGVFKERSLPELARVTAISAADANGDGKIDLIALENDEAVRLISDKNGTGWETAELFKIKLRFSDEISRISAADFDNNGSIDILISQANASETQIFLSSAERNFSSTANIKSPGISSLAETNGDGKLDLIGIDAEGKPTVFQTQTAKNYNWQILRPRAAKTEGDQRINSFGIGGEIELRAGLMVQKRLIESPQVHFGLGEQTNADVVKIVWGNGYPQAEFDLQSNQVIAAEQRLKGSCPHLFAWDGEKFALVKDAPPWSPALGLKINAQDTYGILQTEEWFKIPGEALKPKDGFYELRITGEYWESFYIDNYRLLAVDHPEKTEVFTDERFSIPLPPLKVFTTEGRQNFASVTNDKGENVWEIVSALDEKYLDDFRRGKFQGVAEDHFVEFELPENAPPGKKIWLVADGWIHPTDASINVQRGQSISTTPKSLSLEILDENGEWKIAKDNLGFPAGKMKTVLIDLPENARKFRLRTEMEIFWDRLAWAVDAPETEIKEIPLDLTEANLRYRGFSVIEKADDSSPEKPVYDKILTTNQRWRDLEGFYTRFGDVLELLRKTDDRFVLANAGDEIVLKFPVLPEVPAGWKRDFVIIGNGWIKDGDLNSVFSKTLLPLPTHATNDYTRPPTRLEDDPVYQKNKTDWLNFHTRYVAPDSFRNALRSK